jgi:hypothetical protein
MLTAAPAGQHPCVLPCLPPPHITPSPSRRTRSPPRTPHIVEEAEDDPELGAKDAPQLAFLDGNPLGLRRLEPRRRWRCPAVPRNGPPQPWIRIDGVGVRRLERPTAATSWKERRVGERERRCSHG